MSDSRPASEHPSDILLYRSEDGTIRLDVPTDGETVWLSQQRMADLFGVQRPAITKHLKNIFETGELEEEVVCSILEHTTAHGALAGKTQAQTSKYCDLVNL